MTLVNDIGNNARELLTLTWIEADSEVTNVGVGDYPFVLVGVFFELVVLDFEAALDGSSEFVSDGEGFVSDWVDIDSAELNMSRRCKYLLQRLSIQLQLNSPPLSLRCRLLLQLWRIHLIRIRVKALRIRQ